MADLASQVLQALHALYHGVNPSLKSSADGFLRSFQKQDVAWSISQQLLATHEDPAYQFFGAITLLEKVRTSWNSIDATDQQKLYNAVEIMVPSKIQQRAVFSKTAQVLAALAARALLIQPEDIMEGLLRKCDSEDQLSKFIAFEVFHFLPEEQIQSGLSCGEGKKIKQVLLHFAPQIITRCVEHFKYSQQEIQKQSLKCLKSWMEFGVSLSDLVTSKAVEMFLQMLEIPVLLQDASELLQLTFENHVPPLYFPILTETVRRIPSLKSRFAQAKQAEDDDTCSALSLMIRNLCEFQLTALVVSVPSPNHEGAYPAIVDIFPFVLEILQHQNHQISVNGLDILMHIGDNLMNVTPQQKVLFQGFFQNAVRVIIIQSQMPLDEDLSLDAEFMSYRSTAADAMISCHRFLQEGLMGILLEASQPGNPWNVIESAIYHLHGLVDVLVKAPTELTMVFQLMNKLPPHQLIQKNILLVIESTYEQLHTSDLGRLSMQFIFTCTQNPVLWADAANTFPLVCRSSGHQFATEIQGIKDAILPVIICSPAETKYLNEMNGFRRASRRMNGGVASQFTEGLLILAGYLPLEKKIEIYQEIISIFGQKIQAAASQRQLPGAKEEEVKWLCLFGVVVKCLATSKDVIPIIKEPLSSVWEWIKKYPDYIRTDENLVQVVCQFVHNLGQLLASTSFVQDGLQFISQLYLPAHHQRCIDTIAQCLKYIEKSEPGQRQAIHIVQYTFSNCFNHVSAGKNRVD
eukprot:TRINITY_DN3722_c0_g1_i10.p1 TRINITY_DN3722_c0_g1~~TRINITY_DN3722_c0_g1_i10.p1  ORF type:complete len:746 (-),score=125.26 TRINITY_DN3722_c0_g1_i10:329-2566(-)